MESSHALRHSAVIGRESSGKGEKEGRKWKQRQPKECVTGLALTLALQLHKLRLLISAVP